MFLQYITRVYPPNEGFHIADLRDISIATTLHQLAFCRADFALLISPPLLLSLSHCVHRHGYNDVDEFQPA